MMHTVCILKFILSSFSDWEFVIPRDVVTPKHDLPNMECVLDFHICYASYIYDGMYFEKLRFSKVNDTD